MSLAVPAIEVRDATTVLGGRAVWRDVDVEVEILEDLLLAAHNEAKNKVEQVMQEKTRDSVFSAINI